MSDAFVVLPDISGDSSMWFGANASGGVGVPQVMERWPGAVFPRPAPLQITNRELDQAEQTHGVLISRPHWSWGASMGTNQWGVTIATQAVWTRLDVVARGLSGQDLTRLALERSTDAEEALELLTTLLRRFGQGGQQTRQGSKRSNDHSNSFLIADADHAWVLETAGVHWAARRVRTVWASSNLLSIQRDYDRISPGAIDEAIERGWCADAEDFGFARAFSASSQEILLGAAARREVLTRRLAESYGKMDAPRARMLLTDHNGHDPRDGLRHEAPCVHASWAPTRSSRQTNASLIVQIGASDDEDAQVRAWATGTSAPCLSVFKPMGFDGPALRVGPAPGERFDGESLYWLHERVHRSVLASYGHRRGAMEGRRQTLQKRAFGIEDPASRQQIWQEHLADLPHWNELVEAAPAPLKRPLDRLYWERRNRQDGVPDTTAP